MNPSVYVAKTLNILVNTQISLRTFYIWLSARRLCKCACVCVSYPFQRVARRARVPCQLAVLSLLLGRVLLPLSVQPRLALLILRVLAKVHLLVASWWGSPAVCWRSRDFSKSSPRSDSQSPCRQMKVNFQLAWFKMCGGTRWRVVVQG